MKSLARRKRFATKIGVEYVDGSWPYLTVENPIGVARVVGEAKRAADHGVGVFVRGQVSHHSAMTPSLFRTAKVEPHVLRRAEHDFITTIAKRVAVGRFKRANVAALLQHYGFRTTWLDAVDNLFVAYWFAAHEICIDAEGAITVSASKESSGWIYVLRPVAGCRVVDLRTQHHPLSARPHVQHGISIAAQENDGPDLRESVVATIRTPIKGTTAGMLFDNAHLFPSETLDHTLHLLLKHRVNDVAQSIEATYGLAVGSLGRISWLRAAAA